MISAARWSAILLLFCCAFAASAADRAPLERDTAVIAPLVLRELDQGRFGLGHMLWPERSVNLPLTNSLLFQVPSMGPVRAALAREFDGYVEHHKASLPNESIGVGDGFAFHLFDRTLLDSPDVRFVLAGIVNRMDRAYVAPESCGEVRLIYRLTRTDAPPVGENAVSQRLPMTLNLVLKAKGDHARDRDGKEITCRELARRWLAIGAPSAGERMLDILFGKDGPLDLIAPENIRSIETNLQIAHAPKSATRDFRTDYLMKVFDYKRETKQFEETPLENQIDPERLLSDGGLARDFKAWLLDPKNFEALDRGTILVPDRFLKKSVVAPTPVGFAPSNLQPAFGLVAGEDGGKDPLFAESDVVAALEKAARSGTKLQNIRSVAGFERRLNDMTCSGCHQTRGIGGFHFPGVDWMAARPSNSTVVPASPHFFGDQVRRRDILTAFATGKQPDFSRGFASRPQERGSTELAGTEYEDGWGSHCYVQSAKRGENDKSFSAWSCAEGLACQAGGPTTRMGMCFVKTR